MTAETQQLIDKEVHRIFKGIETEFDVPCELTYVPDYPPLYNVPEQTGFVIDNLENMNDKDSKKVVGFFSGSEDFSC